MLRKIGVSKELRFFLGLLLALLLYLAVSAFFVYPHFTGKYSGREAISSSFDEMVTPQLPVIIIDAGHGGVDGGACDQDGNLEKDINLGIARNLQNFFALSGYETVMTREDDVSLQREEDNGKSRKRNDLLARVDFTEKVGNAVFVSIHQNAFPQSRYRGLQVFYSPNHPDSRLLAECIRNKNREMLDSGNAREVKRAGEEILVLDRCQSPAVLVECGFMSNAEDSRLLRDENYRRKLAFMLYAAICEYAEEMKEPAIR